MGHIFCYLHGEDWADELLAWDRAEELFPDGLPRDWFRLKKMALSAKPYRWYEGRLKLTQSKSRLFDVFSPQCLECGCSVIHCRLLRTHSYEEHYEDVAIACADCEEQWVMRWNNGERTAMWQIRADRRFELKL